MVVLAIFERVVALVELTPVEFFLMLVPFAPEGAVVEALAGMVVTFSIFREHANHDNVGWRKADLTVGRAKLVRHYCFLSSSTSTIGDLSNVGTSVGQEFAVGILR